MPLPTTLCYSPNDTCFIAELMAENAALHGHNKKLNHIIASQHVQLTLNSLAIQKYKHQLYEKEQQVEDKAQQWLFSGKAQIATAPEFRELVQDIQEKCGLEQGEKRNSQRSERRRTRLKQC